MTNPNNVSLNINHELEFIDGHGLDVPLIAFLVNKVVCLRAQKSQKLISKQR